MARRLRTSTPTHTPVRARARASHRALTPHHGVHLAAHPWVRARRVSHCPHLRACVQGLHACSVDTDACRPVVLSLLATRYIHMREEVRYGQVRSREHFAAVVSPPPSVHDDAPPTMRPIAPVTASPPVSLRNHFPPPPTAPSSSSHLPPACSADGPTSIIRCQRTCSSEDAHQRSYARVSRLLRSFAASPSASLYAHRLRVVHSSHSPRILSAASVSVPPAFLRYCGHSIGRIFSNAGRSSTQQAVCRHLVLASFELRMRLLPER